MAGVLVWGNENIGAHAEVRFLSPGHDFGFAIKTDSVQYPAPFAMVLRDLLVRHNTANGNGQNIVYALMVNGVATAVTVTLATGAVVQASDLANSVTIAQGDRVSIRASKAANVANGAVDVQATLKVEAV